MKRRTFVTSSLAAAASASFPIARLFAADGQPITALSDIRAVKLDGSETTIEKAVLKELAGSLSGHILLPNSEGYDSARKGWNGMIDKHPALIVQCANANDITNAVNLAREYELLTAVRGGGHNIAGKGHLRRWYTDQLYADAGRNSRLRKRAQRYRGVRASCLAPSMQQPSHTASPHLQA